MGRSVVMGDTIGLALSRKEVSMGGTTVALDVGIPWTTRNLSVAFESALDKQI